MLALILWSVKAERHFDKLLVVIQLGGANNSYLQKLGSSIVIDN